MSTNGKTLKFRAAKLKGFTVFFMPTFTKNLNISQHVLIASKIDIRETYFL